MLHNYLLLVLRDFKKHPGFYFTNVLSLAVGIAACLMISGYVKFHRSFDTMGSEYKDTYRIQYSRWGENADRVEFASASPTIGPAIKEIFPETVAYARAYKAEGVFFYGDKFFKEEKVFRSESAIFDVLAIPLVLGDKKNCLDDPSSVVISASTAAKYFGNENPVGKVLSLNKQTNLTVTGVFANLEANRHIKADIFTSLNAWIQREPQMFTTGWFYSGFFTYVKFREGTDPEKINEGIAGYINTEFGKDLREYNMGMSFRLQPIADIHLNSHYMHELEANGNKNAVNLLSIVGWFILVIAWVNFINLTTISAIRKQREIAIRKTIGASRRRLLSQLLVWSGSINLAAAIVAMVPFEMASPLFVRFTGIPLEAGIFSGGWFYITLAAAFVAGTLSAGIFAASGSWSTGITTILKGGKTGRSHGVVLKKTLVTLQFAIGIALLAATIGISLQYKYITGKNPGFNLNNILVVNAPVVGDSTLTMRYKTFIDQVSNLPGVQGCAFSSVIPGQSNMFNRGGIYRQGASDKDSRNYRVTETGAGFFETFNIPFMAGESFSGEPASDKTKVVINACAATHLGFSKPADAVGRTIIMEGRPFTVAGVVIDFHQRSAREAIEPQIFRHPQRFQGKFSLNTGKRDPAELMEQTGAIFTSIFPNNPYNASRLSDYYNLQFTQDKNYSIVFILFSLLVIFITILGLIGLSAYTAEQRKKEIGIRKTLGASESWLFFLVFKDYILLCLLAAAIALPLFHIKYTGWLAAFAFHQSPAWYLYTIPVLLVLAISVITVWIQSVAIIRLNPVENLKYE